MVDVQQMKKIVPFITCDITFSQYVCVCIFQSRLRTRRSVGFWFPLILLSGFPVAMSVPGLLDAIRLFADDELVGT